MPTARSRGRASALQECRGRVVSWGRASALKEAVTACDRGAGLQPCASHQSAVHNVPPGEPRRARKAADVPGLLRHESKKEKVPELEAHLRVGKARDVGLSRREVLLLLRVQHRRRTRERDALQPLRIPFGAVLLTDRERTARAIEQVARVLRELADVEEERRARWLDRIGDHRRERLAGIRGSQCRPALSTDQRGGFPTDRGHVLTLQGCGSGPCTPPTARGLRPPTPDMTAQRDCRPGRATVPYGYCDSRAVSVI